MKEELRLVGLGVNAVVDCTKRERPRARKDGSTQRNLVADLPAVLVGELAADDGTLAIDQECLLLLRLQHEFRVHVEIGCRVDRKLREEIAFGYVDSPEPVGPRHCGYARNLPDLLRVGERHREDQRDRIARDQARRRRRLRARVPRFDDRAQQTECRDRDDDADDRQ